MCLKHFSLTVVSVLLGITTMAQSPSKFNYQAVARDASGVVVSSGTVGVKVSILTGSATGTEVYSETHSAATNVYGMMNFQIGAGSGAAGDISTITWGSDAHFIKVEMDPAGGSSYTVSNTSELISVPYAEYANSALHVDDADADSTNEVQMMMMSGDTLMLTIGGGSIDLSGYDQSAGVTSNDSAITANAAEAAAALAAHVTADMDVDSTNELITNMTLGGDTMLQITEDGVTHEVDLTALANDNDWVRSGDTLYNTADSLIGIGTKDPFIDHKMTLQPGNALGGLMITRYESSAAAKAGVSNSDYNGTGLRIGFENTLYDGTSGAKGLSNTIYYMNGTEYGIENSLFYGTGATYGIRNYIYKVAASGTNYASYNYVKARALSYGSYNYVENSSTDNYGRSYGSYNLTRKQSGNYGYSYGTYNYSLNYENGGTAYGSYNNVRALGNSDYAYGTYNYAYSGVYNYGSYNSAGGGSYNYASYNQGAVYSTGGFSSSDRKLKKNIRNYEGAINDIMQLQPRVYEFDLEKYPTMGLPEVEQLGLVAQELEEVFPNLIKETHNPKLQMTESDAIERGFEYEIIAPAEYDEDDKLLQETQVEAGEAVDFKAVNYTALIPVLVKGIQEQQAIIEANEAMIEDLKARIEILEN